MYGSTAVYAAQRIRPTARAALRSCG